MDNKYFVFFTRFKLINRVFRVIFVPIRMKIVFHYLKTPLINSFIWLFKSKELTNFTYDLTDINKEYLASSLSIVTGKPVNEILRYIGEVGSNSKIKRYVKNKVILSNYSFMADEVVNFGRRIGWYALIRALKPKIVVETGVDKGLGSVIIAEALHQNFNQGFPGKYYGTDINTTAGYLFDDEYKKFGVILYGDSIESLRNLKDEIDIFINDSDHSQYYEENEYKAVKSKLSRNAVLIGDNSHSTDKLYRFAMKTKRNFLFWSEKPKDHWYPGAGMGIAFNYEKDRKKD